MGYIVSMIFLVVLFLIVVGIGKLLPMFVDSRGGPETYEKNKQDAKEIGGFITKIGFGATLLIFILVTLFSTIKQVPAGHEGLVYEFNDIVDQRGSGLQVIAPWQGFKVVTTQTQAIRPETFCTDKSGPEFAQSGQQTAECLEAFSSANQDVFIVPTVNLSVNPEDIQHLYTQYPDYIDRLVRPRLHQLFKEETVKYSTETVALNRATIRANVLDALQAALAEFSITVEDLLLDNVDFNAEFKAAIEDKQIARQEALKQLELVTAAEHEASQAVKRAEGEAAANDVLAESLAINGNAILQFRAIEKLSPLVDIIIVDSDSGIIPVLGDITGGGVNFNPQGFSPPPPAPLGETE